MNNRKGKILTLADVKKLKIGDSIYLKYWDDREKLSFKGIVELTSNPYNPEIDDNELCFARGYPCPLEDVKNDEDKMRRIDNCGHSYSMYKAFKQIKFIVEIDASYFSQEMDEELIDNEISTHYNPGSLYLDWKGFDIDNPKPKKKYEEEYHASKKWLVETYGPEIKKFKSFHISPT